MPPATLPPPAQAGPTTTAVTVTPEQISSVRAGLNEPDSAAVSDDDINRFVRATGGDLPHSLSRLQATLAWRRARKPEAVVCKLCAQNPPPAPGGGGRPRWGGAGRGRRWRHVCPAAAAARALRPPGGLPLPARGRARLPPGGLTLPARRPLSVCVGGGACPALGGA